MADNWLCQVMLSNFTPQSKWSLIPEYNCSHCFQLSIIEYKMGNDIEIIFNLAKRISCAFQATFRWLVERAQHHTSGRRTGFSPKNVHHLECNRQNMSLLQVFRKGTWIQLICLDRRNQRLCKIFASCINSFPENSAFSCMYTLRRIMK